MFCFKIFLGSKFLWAHILLYQTADNTMLFDDFMTNDQEGHPPSRVNFTGCLYERKVDPFAWVKSWLSNDNRAHACSDCLTLTELTWLGEQECLYGEKLAWLGGWLQFRTLLQNCDWTFLSISSPVTAMFNYFCSSRKWSRRGSNLTTLTLKKSLNYCSVCIKWFIAEPFFASSDVPRVGNRFSVITAMKQWAKAHSINIKQCMVLRLESQAMMNRKRLK